MRLLVTGGTGFLGSQLVPMALADGHAVVGLARSGAAAAAMGAAGAEVVPGNLDEPASVDAAFTAGKADALVNLASLGFGHAETIVAAAEEAGLRRAVVLSTTAIFTRLDARSKAVRTAAERTVLASDLDVTILRPTMIYGTPGDRNMARLLRALHRLPVLPVPGDGHRLQQPVHVDDLARVTLTAVTAPAAVGRAYDVAGPRPLTFREIVDEAAAAVGRRALVVPLPLGPAVRGLRVYERLAPHPRLRAEQLGRLAEDKAFSSAAAEADLGYAPRPFREGIRAEAAMLR